MGAPRHRGVLLATAGALALACAHAGQLVPAAGAEVEPGKPRVAGQTVEGVRLQVDTSAWHQAPVRGALSPVEVRIRNGSDRPLRIAYSQFTLRRGMGFRVQAMAPFQVAVENGATAVQPDYPGYWMGPWDARFHHPDSPVWWGTGVYDPGYDAAPVAVPDRNVLRHALPEGVAEPGAAVSGFVYFPDQPRGEAVTLVTTLVDAGTNQVFGTSEIPFVVK